MPFAIRPVEPAKDAPAIAKLLRASTSFDGGVPVFTDDELGAVLAHDATEHGALWRVATDGGAIVGVLDVRHVGTKRTAVCVVVNPAFRGKRVATGLLEHVPSGRRLLATSRASVLAATTLLEKNRFTERHRHVRLRRPANDWPALPVPAWARIVEDKGKDPERYRRAARAILSEEDLDDDALLVPYLARPGCRVVYLQSPKGDDGVAVVAAATAVKKVDVGSDGRAKVGVLEKIGLAKELRGKGASRPLVRHALRQIVADGYAVVEVTADKRRPSAVDLYVQEGFEIVDDDVFWIRRDDEG